MMNIVALWLVVTSLATAGVLSPSPNTEKKNTNHQADHDQLVVSKQGLKVIVVEYERESGKTKVSISPQPEDEPYSVDDHVVVAAANKKMNHNVEEIQGDGTRSSGANDNEKANARELICDAFGKCKHKIASAFGKAKEKVAEKAQEVEEEVKEAVEAVGDPFGKGKDVLSREAQEKKERAQETRDKAKNTLKTAFDTGKTLEGDVRRNLSEDLDIARRHTANKAKERLETAGTAAEKVKGVAKDTAKEGLETAGTAAEKVKDVAKDTAKEGLETAGTAAEKVKDKAKEGLETAAGKVKGVVKEKKSKIDHRIWQVRHFGHDAFTYVVAAVSSFLGVLHLLGFAMAYGMSVWITFVSSYVLATALPRQQFGMVQSKIYPLYFRAMAYSIGVALLGHLLSQRTNVSASKAEIFQGYSLIASLLMVFANLLYLEPRATKVMFERMKVEKEEGRGGREMSGFLSKSTGSVPDGNVAAAASTTTSTTEQEEAAPSQILVLNERLKKLNSFSSTLNILTLMSLTWHLVYLGQRLHMSSCH